MTRLKLFLELQRSRDFFFISLEKLKYLENAIEHVWVLLVFIGITSSNTGAKIIPQKSSGCFRMDKKLFSRRKFAVSLEIGRGAGYICFLLQNTQKLSN